MKQLINKIAKRFHTFSSTTLQAIAEAERHFNFKFPEDYKSFLLFSNGIEGQGRYSFFVLWSVEELVTLNEAYNVKEFVSDIIIFGSDGAEDAFAFDTCNQDISIVRLPFIGMGHIPAERISNTFTELFARQI